jgi:hypothetical protein
MADDELLIAQIRRAHDLIASRNLPENEDLYLHELATAVTDIVMDPERGVKFVDGLVASASTAIHLAVLAYSEAGRATSELELMHQIEEAMRRRMTGGT